MTIAWNHETDAIMKEEISAIMGEVVEARRYIHMHPETGFDTQNTEAFVRRKLEAEGIELLPAQMGVLGRIKGRDSSRIVALRADMDALNLQEENDVPYCSLCPGKMHACGHDGHTAMLLGAAKMLQKHRELLPTDVILVFQPAEEGPSPGGAITMLKDLQEKGLADKIEYIFGQHVMNDYPTGTVGIKAGPLMASTDEFYITIIGKGGHAGQPDKNVDALSIGAKVVTAMESFMSRKMNPFDPAVFSVGIFQSGSAINIVADTAKISGTIRCMREETREYILENMNQIVKGLCAAFGADCEIKIIRGLPPLINDEAASAYARKVAEATAGAENVVTLENRVMGAEDFAYFAKSIPSSFLWIGSGNAEKGITSLAHHPKFDFDEDVMELGVRLLCNLALNR